jgi:hypothetical protein
MSGSFQDRLRKAPAATERFAGELFRELAPKILFFFTACLVIFLLFKLFVANYSPVTFPAFTRAAVAALILGKVIPLLDWADRGYKFENHRRIVVALGKTLVYALVVIVLGTAERIFVAFREQGSLSAAMHFVIANASSRHFLGLVLLLSLVVGPYLTFQEIEAALGKGTLFRLLWQRPLERKG